MQNPPNCQIFNLLYFFIKFAADFKRFIMKKFIVFISAALLLLSSCNETKTSGPEEGTYLVDSSTLLQINGMQNVYSDYADAELVLSKISGSSCTVTMNNLVTGQSSVEMKATCEELDGQTEPTIKLNGTCESGDRSVTLSAVISGSFIKELVLAEQVNSPVVGLWAADTVIVAYQHPDMKTVTIHITPDYPITLDIQTQLIPMLNNMINESLGLDSDPQAYGDYIEFASDGFLVSGVSFDEDRYDFMYFVDDNAGTINLYLRKSVVEEMAMGYNEFIQDDPEMSALLALLGIGAIFAEPTAQTIPFLYEMPSDKSLHIYVDQTLAYPVIKQNEASVKLLVTLLETLTYEQFQGMADRFGELEAFVNESNFEEFKAIIIQFVNTFTDGKATYSVKAEFIPYTANA